jgi:hypothetical protein
MMAVHHVALRTIMSWLAPINAQERAGTAAHTPMPRQERSPHSLNFAALDELDEAAAQRVRTAGQDLIKFQSISRGF